LEINLKKHQKGSSKKERRRKKTGPGGRINWNRLVGPRFSVASIEKS